MKKPVLGITAGDPCGIGPEIALKAAQSPAVRRLCTPVIFGSYGTLAETARRLRLRGPVSLVDTGRVVKPLAFGRPSAKSGREALQALDGALAALSAGLIDGLVTAPLSKEAVVASGQRGFTGHTGYVAAFAGNPEHCLALYAEGRCIAFVSTHVSLAEGIRRVKKARIVKVGKLLDGFLRGVLPGKKPRIAVSGLNPHAGEGGLFGSEEKKEIVPAIKALQKAGIRAVGPLPPDVVFPALFAGRYDGVVSMVHDHGHVAFKTALFRLNKSKGALSGVNVTLGLPVIRTSADHGTAFDIAGKGIADPGSLIDAVRLAAAQADRSVKTRGEKQ
ncbi:MAG: 4-hydroxythreonine-4-phosphate dehydrogenase PdxA [Fibrobacterota bacterium]